MSKELEEIRDESPNLPLIAGKVLLGTKPDIFGQRHIISPLYRATESLLIEEDDQPQISACFFSFDCAVEMKGEWNMHMIHNNMHGWGYGLSIEALH